MKYTFLANFAYSAYILTSNSDTEFDGNLISRVGDLSFYKVSDKEYRDNIHSFNQNFDVEKEVYFSVDQIYFQSPGDTFFTSSQDVPWHLDRINKRNLPLDGKTTVNSCLSNEDIRVDTYIVDTGIDINHPEFGGRATWLWNFADDGKDYDGNGHGTHCAGLVGSSTYGSCNDANLFAVKVLDSQGSGSMSGVLAGIDASFKRHLSSGNRTRSIVSMSLGGGYSKALNRAIEKMLETSSTFNVVTAAGNEDSNACNVSPASANGVITVMASDIRDTRAYFSNYGKCADIYSPGVDILSTIPDNGSARMSGTSMATPIFSGVLNHYINNNPELGNKQLRTLVVSDGTKDTISKNPKNTNNLFVYLQ